MKRVTKLIGLATLSSVVWAAAEIVYPPARVETISGTRFGTLLSDPYRWLENAHSPETQTWVHAEDQLAKAWLSKLPRRAALVKRLTELYDVDQISVPEKDGSRLFYTHRQPHQEKAAVYWREGETGKERAFLDPNVKTNPSENYSLGALYPAPDGTHLAYSEKLNNADQAVLHIRAVDTGEEDRQEIIPGADVADVSWTPDSRGFYYTRLPTDPKIAQADRVADADVRYHRLGADPRQDGSIYPKAGDASVYLSPHVSRDGRWLFINVIRGWTSNDIYVRDLKTAGAAFQPLFISTSATASAIAWKGQFYLTTNQEASHQQVFLIDPEHRDRRFWKVIVPERKDTAIQAAYILGGHLVLSVLKDVSSQIEIRGLDGKEEHRVELPDVGSVQDISGREDDDKAYLAFESFFIPPRVYSCSLSSGKIALWAETHLPIHPEPYQIERVSYHSKDGTPISMFLVHRRNIPKDNSTPFQILGYGGFQEAMVPRFNAAIYPWLEAGGGVAIPHLRGGGEYGEAWHRAGMLTKKQNTFDDMIAAADYLIQKGYTQESILAIQGASNGGLLVGAVLTQRPDLFRAVVCKNPLLDMIRYPLYGEGKAWIPEYGSPDTPEEFHALSAYSPYHHVKKGVRYPSVLFMSAEQDDRVDPMHARKMAAALQAATASKNPILFRVLMQSGHSGADRVASEVDEMADRLDFLLEEIGQGHFTLAIGFQGSWPGIGN